MEYNLKIHGDDLEKSYSEFILTHFKTYEAVWKMFIGNKGNNIKADIENYPLDKDLKRQKFSEHTYTVLQSVILLHRLIDKGVFNAPIIPSTENILNLQDNLILFFTHLGRIMNNVEDASRFLELKQDKTSDLLKEFYHKRHVFVHGKTLPIIFKETGEILLPLLSKSNSDTTGWNHKEHSWTDAASLPNLEANQTASTLFWELLPKLEEIFGQFKKTIEKELNKQNLKLKFEYKTYIDLQSNPSGSSGSAKCTTSIYGVDKT